MLATAVHPKLAHIIPNFQNPAGYTLSAEKRTRLLELAVEHDFTIFEDDPYVSIRFEGETIPTMFSQDEAGRSSTRPRSARPSARASASATWSARRP